MAKQHYATYEEIINQTKAWLKAIEKSRSASFPDLNDYDQDLFTECGFTYYLSLGASTLFQELNDVPAPAVPGSELLLESQNLFHSRNEQRKNKTLLVAVSRSGTTTETVKAVEKYKTDRREDAVGICNYEEVLSKLSVVNFLIPLWQEESVAQTRSFASKFVAPTTLLCV